VSFEVLIHILLGRMGILAPLEDTIGKVTERVDEGSSSSELQEYGRGDKDTCGNELSTEARRIE